MQLITTSPLAPGLSLSGLTPADLGLPAKFEEFRKEQIQAIEMVANSEKRHTGLCMPMGLGKSLVPVVLHKLTGARVAVLTHTLGLMDQYLRDFQSIGMIPIMGRSNYACQDHELGTDCRLGGYAGCRYKGTLGCDYESARDSACNADLDVTNYAYWVKSNQWGIGLERGEDEGKNPFDLLVLDEAHLAFEALAAALRVTLRESSLITLGVQYDKDSEEPAYWASVAVKAATAAAGMMTDLTRRLKNTPRSDRTPKAMRLRQQVKELDEVKDSVERLASVLNQGSVQDDWVCEQRKGTEWGRVWDFDCVWPAQYAESRLFMGIPHVIEMSATLKPMSIHALGVQKQDLEFREWPRAYPASHTPIYYQPSLHPETRKQIRLNYRTSLQEWERIVRDMDDWIEPRFEDWRSGLIHTVSFDRQKMVRDMSRWRDYMLLNGNEPDSLKAQRVFEEYCERVRAGERCILISPSFSTGWNLPGRLCEWQVILKLAFKPESKVIKARLKRWPRYQSHTVMQNFMQETGRASRFYRDRCEVLVKDGNLGFFLQQNRDLAPIGFDVLMKKPEERIEMRERAPETE